MEDQNPNRKSNFPILSNRQIYPESPHARKLSPQKEFNGSTTSLNSDSTYGSRKLLNVVPDGAKFCLIQGDQQSMQGKKKI